MHPVGKEHGPLDRGELLLRRDDDVEVDAVTLGLVGVVDPGAGLAVAVALVERRLDQVLARGHVLEDVGPGGVGLGHSQQLRVGAVLGKELVGDRGAGQGRRLLALVDVDRPVDPHRVAVEGHVHGGDGPGAVDATGLDPQAAVLAGPHHHRAHRDPVDQVDAVAVGDRGPADLRVGLADHHDARAGDRVPQDVAHRPAHRAAAEEGEIQLDRLAVRPHPGRDLAPSAGGGVGGHDPEGLAAVVLADVAQLVAPVAVELLGREPAAGGVLAARVLVVRVGDDAGGHRRPVGGEHPPGDDRPGVFQERPEGNRGRRSLVAAQVTQASEDAQGRRDQALGLLEAQEHEAARELALRPEEAVSGQLVARGLRRGRGVDDPVEDQGGVEPEGAGAVEDLGTDHRRREELRAGGDQGLGDELGQVPALLLQGRAGRVELDVHELPVRDRDGRRHHSREGPVAAGEGGRHLHAARGVSHQPHHVRTPRGCRRDGEERSGAPGTQREEDRALDLGHGELVSIAQERRLPAGAVEQHRLDRGRATAVGHREGDEVGTGNRHPGRLLLQGEGVRRSVRVGAQPFGEGGAEGVGELEAGLGLPQELVEAGVGSIGGPCAPEVEGHVAQGGGEALSETDAEARLGQGQALLGHGLAARADDVARQRPGRRAGHAPRLAEDSHRRLHHRGRELVHRRGEDQGVGRERDTARADAHRELEASSGLAGLEAEVARGHLAGDLRHEVQLEGGRLAGRDFRDGRRGIAHELRPARRKRARIEEDRLRRSLADVGQRREDGERLARPDDTGDGEGHVEEGVADEDAPEARPLMRTGPVARPLSRARMSKSMVWKPSDSPRRRNSA